MQLKVPKRGACFFHSGGVALSGKTVSTGIWPTLPALWLNSRRSVTVFTINCTSYLLQRNAMADSFGLFTTSAELKPQTDALIAAGDAGIQDIEDRRCHIVHIARYTCLCILKIIFDGIVGLSLALAVSAFIVCRAILLDLEPDVAY